jgi:hypothetical protein
MERRRNRKAGAGSGRRAGGPRTGSEKWEKQREKVEETAEGLEF